MKKETTKIRLKQMLSDDREEMNDATKAAALADFTHIAKEYFETDNVAMNVKKGKSSTDVSVTFKATRVKNFTPLK